MQGCIHTHTFTHNAERCSKNQRTIGQNDFTLKKVTTMLKTNIEVATLYPTAGFVRISLHEIFEIWCGQFYWLIILLILISSQLQRDKFLRLPCCVWNGISKSVWVRGYQTVLYMSSSHTVSTWKRFKFLKGLYKFWKIRLIWLVKFKFCWILTYWQTMYKVYLSVFSDLILCWTYKIYKNRLPNSTKVFRLKAGNFTT